MPNTSPPPDQQVELLALVNHLTGDDLDGAACRGRSPDDYHPEVGRPGADALALCVDCRSRLGCVALALRAEDPDYRQGWYGGLSPAERQGLAEALHLARPARGEDDLAAAVAQLRGSGKTVAQIAQQIGRSRRTVQRYLNGAA